MPEEQTAKVSRLPEPEHTSEAEEMYLITVARLVEDGIEGPVPVASLAKDLQVSVASANEMIRKLAARSLLTYEPYRGVELTAGGAVVADRVLRTRRLWATFLAEHLGLSPQEADDQACLLEHVTMPEATNRLAEFLGDPTTGPLGRPIPQTSASATPPPTRSLADLGVGEAAEIVAVRTADPARTFLTSEGVVPGARTSVVGLGESGMLIDIDGRHITVTNDLAGTIEIHSGVA